MSVVNGILGIVEDSPPVPTGRTRPARSSQYQQPEIEDSADDDDEDSQADKKLAAKAAQARTGSVVAGILGMSESDNEAIIPTDAQPLDSFRHQQIPGLNSLPTQSSAPAEPAITLRGAEELIPPTAALVAPDITPNFLLPIDPMQAPAPPAPVHRPVPPGGAPQSNGHTLDTILGRQNGTPQPQPDLPPVSPEAFEHMINPIEVQAKVDESLTPSSEGGSMPLHQEGDGKTIFRAFRKIVG